jgi:hypothetical protein
MVTQTWTYQPKNTEEMIGKEKKIQVRNECIGNTEKFKLLIIHRRARRGEEEFSFVINHNFLCLLGCRGGCGRWRAIGLVSS